MQTEEMSKLKRDDLLLEKIGNEESLSSNDKDLYKQIFRTIASWAVGETRTENQVWDSIEQQSNVRSNKWNRFISIGVAASVVVAVFAIQILMPSQVELSVPKGEASQTFELPDGSTVIANAGSQISFDKHDWEEGQRSLYLEGLAYFDVQRGSTFQVNTQHGVVEVLGTSFNVKAYDKDFVVECITGKVSVSTSSQINVLTPGLKTYLSGTNLIQPEKFNPQKSSQWLDGKFYFYNSPITEVIQEVENQFAVKVEMEIDLNSRYTGSFDNKNLKQALEMVCKPMNFKFTIDDNTSSVSIWNFNSIN